MKRIAVALLCALPITLAGCSSSGGSSSSPATAAGAGSSSAGAVTGTITVLAASSLTEAFTTIAKQVQAKYPGTTITLSFGASSDLSTQITQGKAADVFASASKKNMDAVVASKDADPPTDFVANTLEIAVPPANPGKITKLADLAKPGVKVGVCAAEVPCGAVAAQVFSNAKLAVKPVASLEDVKSTLALVESGEVDAGLVYATDVRSAGTKVNGIAIPDDVNASTTYPIATLTHAKNAPLAKAFVAYVLSADGQRVLAADGFAKP